MASEKNLLLGIGNPLLDISAHVELDLLKKYDLKEKSAILAEDKHLPLYEEMIKGYKVEYIAGGATQNSIRAAQWMLQGQGKTHFIGCIGKDDFGKELSSAASGSGVNTHYQYVDKFPTGTCAVLVHNSDRTLVANLGAANHYDKTHFDSDEIQEVLNSVETFYAAGFFLTVSTNTLVALGEHAVKHEKTFAFNISAEFLVHVFGEQLNKVLPFVDLLFANEVEMAAYGKSQDWGDDLKEITKKLAAEPTKGNRTRMVITTRGPDSAYVSEGGSDIVEYPATKVPADEIVDVNGAGDAFVGGFLSVWVQEKNIKKAMHAGHYAASVCIRASGATFPEKPQCSFN